MSMCWRWTRPPTTASTTSARSTRRALRAGERATRSTSSTRCICSHQAFNALLERSNRRHAKFVFATTEIRKVPVTLLSRCQRFDLRRVEPGRWSRISKASPPRRASRPRPRAALGAGGRARCATRSLLDQARTRPDWFARGRAADARLADRKPRHRPVRRPDAGRHRGCAQGAARPVRPGADPAVVLTDLAEFTHFVTRGRAGGRGRPLARRIERTRGNARSRRVL